MTYSKKYVHAWFVWSISAVFFFYKYMLEVSPSVMTSDLMASFQIGGSNLGNLASSYFYAYTIMQTPVGLLLDRFGPRRVTSLAIILCGVGACFFAESPTFWMALVSRFVIGVGASFAAVNIFKLSANWFPPHWFAFMVGLSMTLGMLGAVGGEEPLAAFIHSFSWRTSILYLGVFGVILSLIFFLIVRDYPRDHIDVLHTKKKGAFFKNLRKIIKNPQNWIISVYSGLMFAPVSVFGGLWGVPFLQEAYQIPKELAARCSSLIFVGFAVGAPFLGWFSDRIGKRNPIMMGGTILSILLLLLIIYYPHLPLSLIFVATFLLGFFISGFLVSFTVIREFNSPMVTATAIGIMNTFNAVFIAFANPLIGKFLDVGWDGTMREGAHVFSVPNYQWALITLPIFCVISLILLFFTKETNCKAVSPK